MASKSSKIAKNKHGVRMIALEKDSTASPTASKNPIPTESKQSLNVEPLQHAISKPIKGDFTKKKFMTGTSKRYKSSLSGISIPAAAPVTEAEEEALDVDDIIMQTTAEILSEAADHVLGSDVGPDVTISGNPKSPNLETPVAVPVEEPIGVQSENEKEDSADQESEEEQEEDGSEPP